MLIRIFKYLLVLVSFIHFIFVMWCYLCFIFIKHVEHECYADAWFRIWWFYLATKFNADNFVCCFCMFLFLEKQNNKLLRKCCCFVSRIFDEPDKQLHLHLCQMHHCLIAQITLCLPNRNNLHRRKYSKHYDLLYILFTQSSERDLLFDLFWHTRLSEFNFQFLCDFIWNF